MPSEGKHGAPKEAASLSTSLSAACNRLIDGMASRSTRFVAEDRQTSFIESVAIPYLTKSACASDESDPTSITSAQVSEFTRLLLRGSEQEQTAFTAQLGATGSTLEVLMLDLFTPTARELGERWENDTSSFVEVTVALLRLQQILRAMSADSASSWLDCNDHLSALFTAMPEDQHGFGVMLVEEMFSRAGWKTTRAIGSGASDLCRRVASSDFDLVGITVSCDPPENDLASFVEMLRRASPRKRLVVMLGGPTVLSKPNLPERVGADGSRSNALTAVVAAQALVNTARREARRR